MEKRKEKKKEGEDGKRRMLEKERGGEIKKDIEEVRKDKRGREKRR